MTRLAAIAVLLLACAPAAAKCPVPMISQPTDVAKKLAISKLSPLLACSADDPINDQSPCNTFAGRGLEAIYNVKDFKNGTGYLSANAIWDFVNGSSRWVSVGAASDEDANLCAQALANSAYPVIASLKAAGHGHIALIIPGEASKSPSFGILVAYSASFFYKKPDSAYVGGPLSKAFSPDAAKKAVIFYRKLDGQF